MKESYEQRRLILKETKKYAAPNAWTSLLLQNHLSFRHFKKKDGTTVLVDRSKRGKSQVWAWHKRTFPGYWRKQK